ncbi:unnamed protein product, partial [Musa banksii]
ASPSSSGPHLPGPMAASGLRLPRPPPSIRHSRNHFSSTRKFEGEFRKTLAKSKEIVGDDVDAVFNFVHLATRALVGRSPCCQGTIARNNFSSVDWLVKSTDPTWGIEIEIDSKVGFAILSIKKRFV